MLKATGTPFSIRVLRYDGTEHRRWNARLVRRDDPLLILEAEFDVEVQHSHVGHIPQGTRTVECYWHDRWYNIFEFLDEAGQTRLWYCNVNLPPVIDESSIAYVDLDLDLLVRTDFSYQILDADEFEHHARLFGYPQEVQESAHRALRDLISRIEMRQFPFSQLRIN
jgi:protein associated with RNAse G/E